MKKLVTIKICSVAVLMIAIVFLSVALCTERNSFDKNCVPDEDCAVKIAKAICESVYPQFDYSKYEWKCFYNDNKGEYEKDTWIVFCSDGDGFLGGGLPEIHIKRDNAQVVHISLSS